MVGNVRYLPVRCKYPLISSLTTLAYEGRGEEFFKLELFAALTILEQRHVKPDALIGSWAGAMGQVQFMPSSYLAFAVDPDGDGCKELWGSLPDRLNLKICHCGDYAHRFRKVPDCIQLSADKIADFAWLPDSCAYRRLAEGRPLPEWHPLLTGSRSAMHAARRSVRGKVIHERERGDREDHIVTWAL